MTGSDAIMVENHQCPVGSYCCCHPPGVSSHRRMTTAAMIATRVKTSPDHPDEVGGDCFVVSAETAMLAPPGKFQLRHTLVRNTARILRRKLYFDYKFVKRTHLTGRCDIRHNPESYRVRGLRRR